MDRTERQRGTSPGKRRAAGGGRRLLPPPRLMKIVGSGSAETFVRAGESFFSIFQRHARLRPSDRVLDVGCGCGRMARPLTRYLTTGSYDGFDIVPELVEWCRANITPRHPNFRFKRVDVANTFYHGAGATSAAGFRFPYDDGSFDFTILASVFTHMLPRDLVRYAAEIARTLKPGGTALMTFFLLNDESLRLKETARSRFRFLYPWEGGLCVEDPDRPEGAVAYPEERVRAILREHGLVTQQILLGSWCGREHAVSGQDILIARKATGGLGSLPTPTQRLRRFARRVKRRLVRDRRDTPSKK
jgi:SAM-dependent methyltransferase